MHSEQPTNQPPPPKKNDQATTHKSKNLYIGPLGHAVGNFKHFKESCRGFATNCAGLFDSIGGCSDEWLESSHCCPFANMHAVVLTHVWGFLPVFWGSKEKHLHVLFPANFFPPFIFSSACSVLKFQSVPSVPEPLQMSASKPRHPSRVGLA